MFSSITTQNFDMWSTRESDLIREKTRKKNPKKLYNTYEIQHTHKTMGRLIQQKISLHGGA